MASDQMSLVEDEMGTSHLTVPQTATSRPTVMNMVTVQSTEALAIMTDILTTDPVTTARFPPFSLPSTHRPTRTTLQDLLPPVPALQAAICTKRSESSSLLLSDF